LSTTPTTLDSGASADVWIQNTGTTRVTIVNGSEKTWLSPGRDMNVIPTGTVTAAVAAVDGGTGTVFYDPEGSSTAQLPVRLQNALAQALSAQAPAAPVASAATSGTLTAGAEHNLSPSSAATWTLPTGVTSTTIPPTTVKNNGTATVTVARGGNDTINGGTGSVALAPGEWARFTSNGAGAWTQSGTAGQAGTFVQTATGAVKAYTQASQPSSAATGDLWFPTTPLTPSAIGAEATANKGAANGYAGLDANGLVALAAMNSFRALRSGYYYHLGPQGTTGTGTLTTAVLRLTPIIIPKAITISRMFAEVTSGGDVGSTLRLGIYADDGSGLPGALVLDAGTVNGNSVAVQEVTISQALAAGTYWVGAVAQNVTTTQPTVRTVSGQPEVNVPAGTSLPAANNTVFAVNMTGVTGALPSTFTYGSSSSFTARVGIKVA
jgi:hypothetical protein